MAASVLVAPVAVHTWCTEVGAELQLPFSLELLSRCEDHSLKFPLHHRCVYSLHGPEEGMLLALILSLSASHLLNCFSLVHIPVKSEQFWLTLKF